MTEYFLLFYIQCSALIYRDLTAPQYLGVLLATSFMLLAAATEYVFFSFCAYYENLHLQLSIQIVPFSILIGLAVPIPFWIIHRIYPKSKANFVVTPILCCESLTFK